MPYDAYGSGHHEISRPFVAGLGASMALGMVASVGHGNDDAASASENAQARPPKRARAVALPAPPRARRGPESARPACPGFSPLESSDARGKSELGERGESQRETVCVCICL